MTAAIQPVVPTMAPRVPTDLPGVIAYQLERDLTGGPEPRPLRDVDHAIDLTPAASAGRVRWRHAPVLLDHPAVAPIAEVLDEARGRVATARAAWPSNPLPILDQSVALEHGRAELRAAAELLIRAKAMASCNGLRLAVNVSRDLFPASGEPASVTHASIYLLP